MAVLARGGSTIRCQIANVVPFFGLVGKFVKRVVVGNVLGVDAVLFSSDLVKSLLVELEIFVLQHTRVEELL